ncbi:zinc-binding dehydrogenase [Escherichia coli]|uniref:zinc-binding dehydrogenase n=1 Tax=Escherichia coli TaxID=562 RepID=UPI00185919D3|nr:zinc-binding dehydrogenase [Escherichia coli]EFB2766070.1 zinc-binding dehydrogenase [Escherichia coli]
MKSILIEKPNQLAIVEREIPTPSAGEVRVKVKLAGICGSDSHIYRGHGHGQPTENDTVLVYGAGPIGLTIVQVLKGVYNVKNVIVADRIDERLEKAKESGADWAINNSQTPLGEIFTEKGIKPTLIIDAACHPSILKEAVTLASPAARIVLMGFSSEPSEVIQQGITGKELSIFSSRLNANKFPIVIDWLSKGLIKPEKLITHTFDFQHVADAISLFEQDQKHCCKVLLTFSE